MPQPATLYSFVPFDRSGRVRWYLEELGHPYRDETLEFGPAGSLGPEYRRLSPAGKVPALVDGEVVLFETGAALEYLAETYAGEAAPRPGDADRAAFLSWMYFATSSLDPVCFEFVRPDMPEELRPARRARAREEVARLLETIDGALAERETFLERGFTPVDIQLTGPLVYAAADGRLEDFPRLAAYVERMKARPAAQAAKAFRG